MILVPLGQQLSSVHKVHIESVHLEQPAPNTLWQETHSPSFFIIPSLQAAHVFTSTHEEQRGFTDSQLMHEDESRVVFSAQAVQAVREQSLQVLPKTLLQELQTPPKR